MTGARTTIAEIASLADTSVSTVSKVLNGRHGVSDAKRDEILDLLKSAGYARRGEGRRSPSRLIDVVLPDVHSLWSARLLFGAEAEASRSGMALVVSSVHGRTLGNKLWLERFKQRRSDGLLVVASRVRPAVAPELARLRAPYVMLDAMGMAPAGVPVVGATNFAGARDATQHLTELGHTKIAIISGPPDLPYAQERIDGYRTALTRAGVAADPTYERYGMFDVESGYRLGGELLDLPSRPTAIFAGSDLQAHGLYKAAKERGVSIPGDLSVVGFDNLQSCEWATPELTTVDQPLEDMAALATRMLIAMALHDARPQGDRVELATSLVVRESTAPPPSAS